MPNTEVKLTNAESTWPEAAREDRKLLIKEKTLTNVGVFFHMPGLPIRTGYRDRRRTSFEGAKGRAKDSETATQRRDRKLLIKEKDLQRCESFFHMHKFERE